MSGRRLDRVKRTRATFEGVRLAVSLVHRAGPREFWLIIAATSVTSGVIAGQLLVGRKLLDLLADRDDVAAGDLAPYLALLGALLMVAALSQTIAAELRLPLSEEVHRRAINEVLDVATEAELEAFEETEFHDRLQRARLAAGDQSSAVVFGLVTVLSTTVVTVGVIAVLVSVVPLLVPIAVLGYVPVVVVNVRNNRARHQMETELTELHRNRSYLEFLMTDRAEAKELRAYETAPQLRGWHGELTDTRMTKLRRLVRTRLALTTAGAFVTTAALVATLSFALVLAARGSITIGEAAVAIVGLQQLSGRLQSAGSSLGSVHEGVTFLRDFDRFRSELPAIRARRPTGTPPALPTRLSVEGVSYRYPGSDNDALRNVSFELDRGQIMAVVGANGSGKSTLAKLLCDLLSPAEGTIRWDGIDLAHCDPTLVRAQIAPVFQEYTRYLLTMRRTIGLGDTNRMDDETGILLAADRAGISDLIDSHRAGLETRLGKMFSDGIDVSGGQWQRLAIARALFRDAPVVVLDEPSASLDPRAESDLFDLLHEWGRDRLVVFVSHRFATVRSADVVMVLDQGEVVEIGSHDELMAVGGLYHDLFTLQAERYGIAP